MLTTLVQAFTKGDLAELKSKLLHSTSWAQHNAKSYGEDKLNAIPVNWLKLAGACHVEQSDVVSQGHHQVINLVLRPDGADNKVNYTFWLETNGQVIKSVDAIVDTMQLTFATSQTTEKVVQALPQPDAFVLQDYDQQDHLQDELATPSNVAGLSGDLATLLDTWWSVWSSAQFSGISQVYAEDAEISLPGSALSSGPTELFNYVLNKYSQLTRVFCQIEKVAVEANKVAVKWYLDGDENGKRIRASFISVLTLDKGKVTADITTSDILAHINRFPDSELFNG